MTRSSKRIRQDVRDYRRILKKWRQGDVCIHCILSELFGLSVAFIYDSTVFTDEISSQWHTAVEPKVDEFAQYFINLIPKDNNDAN